ncbi:protein C3orf33-like [Mytilus californianus]|uniref:protein C3orf33-like n=1 Tax=Mytilus californianus TaxID=6549 RepID=UPI0022461F57|nr:protein C3orf33-like [Mytilus californianus]
MSDNSREPLSSIIKSYLDRTHDFIDTHPKAIRNSFYIVGGAGIVLLLKSIHVGKFFRHGKDIPKRFISKGVHLQGCVKEIDLNGIVYVQHIPILDLRLPWLRTPRTELLPMTLAFVNLTPNSKKWLEQNLLDTHIWFKVLRWEKDNDQLQAALFHQKFLFWTTCINEKLIKEGICKVSNLSDEEMKMLTEKQEELLHRMGALERTADRKGKGIWKEEKPPLKETVKAMLYKSMYAPVIFGKYLYKIAKNKFKR